jgi:hypothetical protein
MNIFINDCNAFKSYVLVTHFDRGKNTLNHSKERLIYFTSIFFLFSIDLTISTLWKLKNLFRTNILTHFQVVCHVFSSSFCVQRGERDLLVRGACACP